MDVVEKVESAKTELRREIAEAAMLESSLESFQRDSAKRIQDARRLVVDLTSAISSVDISSDVDQRRADAAQRLADAQNQLKPRDAELTRLAHAVSLLTNITGFEWISDDLAVVTDPRTQSATEFSLDRDQDSFHLAQQLWSYQH